MDAFAAYCTVAVMLMSSCSRNCRGSNLSVITGNLKRQKFKNTSSVLAMNPLSERKSRISTSGCDNLHVFVQIHSKKFQSFQDRRLRVNEGDSMTLKKARTDGKFHEALLDRCRNLEGYYTFSIAPLH